MISKHISRRIFPPEQHSPQSEKLRGSAVLFRWRRAELLANQNWVELHGYDPLVTRAIPDMEISLLFYCQSIHQVSKMTNKKLVM